MVNNVGHIIAHCFVKFKETNSFLNVYLNRLITRFSTVIYQIYQRYGTSYNVAIYIKNKSKQHSLFN